MSGPFMRPNRLWRMLHLLRLLLPSRLPFTHRRNRITLYRGGGGFFPSLFDAIRKAERFILAEYYIVHNDRTGTAFADALTDAVRRGVQVFLIYDYIGCIDTPAVFFRNLAAAGVEVVPFNVPSFRRGIHLFDRRNHRKMTVVDGRLAFLGGFNIGEEYSGLAEQPRRFYDMGFSLEGSAIGELVHIFAETWQKERGQPLLLPPGADSAAADGGPPGGADVVIISGGPDFPFPRIRNAYLISIASATEEILVITPYFVPGLRMIRALLRAARRGVRVRLLLPARSDMPAVRILAHAYYGVMLRAGIAIGEMAEEILHAKVMLIDGRQAVIGSANLDQRSFHRNYEINFMISDEDLAGRIRAIHEEDFANAQPVSLTDHERRGMVVRLLERFIGLFGWFL